MLAFAFAAMCTSPLQPEPIDWQARATALAAEVRHLKAQLLASRATSLATEEHGLSVNVQVAQLDSGTGGIPMPANTSHVVLEIGCSDRNTLDDELLPYDPEAFLISFEPMLDKYAVLAARGTTRYFGTQSDQAVPLGHHHQRGVILPIAISEDGGPVAFNVGRVAGCSSILPTNANATYGKWCQDGLERREVPTMTLASAIGLAGPLPIELVKIDVQGLDASLVMATDASLLFSKVRRVQLETVADRCDPLYEGQVPCHTIIDYMRGIGYRVQGGEYAGPLGRRMDADTAASCSSAQYGNCEADLIFEREE